MSKIVIRHRGIETWVTEKTAVRLGKGVWRRVWRMMESAADRRDSVELCDAKGHTNVIEMFLADANEAGFSGICRDCGRTIK